MHAFVSHVTLGLAQNQSVSGQAPRSSFSWAWSSFRYGRMARGLRARPVWRPCWRHTINGQACIRYPVIVNGMQGGANLGFGTELSPTSLFRNGRSRPELEIDAVARNSAPSTLLNCFRLTLCHMKDFSQPYKSLDRDERHSRGPNHLVS